MVIDEWIIIAAGVSGIALLLLWTRTLGRVRGPLAWLFRVCWLAPIFCGFFPESRMESRPPTYAGRTIHLLVDDSLSMRAGEGKSHGDHASDIATELENECTRLGCVVKETRLSDEVSDMDRNLTPLGQGLVSWLYRVGHDPWIAITDGGDYLPTQPWNPALRGTGRGPEGEARGLIVGFEADEAQNVWIDSHSLPPFSFEEKSILGEVFLGRDPRDEGDKTVQIQVRVEEQVVASVNAFFPSGIFETNVQVAIPPLSRGNKLLSLSILPLAGERTLWDNEQHATIEVLPNTLGILHLLGSPSWDGRFLRRYLKSEPRYDLISFFILRDPWDSQRVSERELSLIPFPVERLFKEELPNFRVVILQNFTLVQFLLPEYQQNLVDFVKSGGGLLFLGGPRSLKPDDLQGSPLREILPFETSKPASQQTVVTGKKKSTGPVFDANVEFELEFAKPNSIQRALANIFDEWQDLIGGRKMGTFQGMNRTDRVTFKPGEHTPLLNAKTNKGKVMPLAVASYPDRGRALWMFSDAFWSIGLQEEQSDARSVYHQFFHRAMTWLLRQDLRKPLTIEDFTLTFDSARRHNWQATLKGPATAYLTTDEGWNFTVCGERTDLQSLVTKRISQGVWKVFGEPKRDLVEGERCTLDIAAENQAFGSVKARSAAIVPKIFLDNELGAAPQKLGSLAELTGAGLQVVGDSDRRVEIEEWLAQVTGTDGIPLPSRFRTLQDHYWALKRWWIWLVVFGVVGEVVVRRWHRIFTTRDPRAVRAIKAT